MLNELRQPPAPPKFGGPLEVSMGDAHPVKTTRFLKLTEHMWKMEIKPKKSPRRTGFFSSLSVQKEDRKLRHKNRRRKKRSGAPEESQKAFTMAEMQLVIKDSKNNRASGEDDIPYEFIKHSWTESQRTH